MKPRFRRRVQPVRWLIALLALAALLRVGGQVLREDRSTRPHVEEGSYRVVRVVDGDTILVRSLTTASAEPVRVRLLGIDAPESVKPDHPVEASGPEAAEFVRQFVRGGTVQLQFDKRRYDQYDRLLAYVFVDGQMLNEELLRAGLARVSAYPGDSATMARRLQRAAEEARRAGRGIWSRTPSRSSS